MKKGPDPSGGLRIREGRCERRPFPSEGGFPGEVLLDFPGRPEQVEGAGIPLGRVGVAALKGLG